MGKIEGVIFDMDGLLFDTERISFNIWKKVLKDFGYNMTNEIYTSLMGRNHEGVNEILMKEYGQDLPIVKIRLAKEIDMKNYINDNGAPVKLGAYELLNFLADKEYKVALATSSCREVAVKLLKMAGIRDNFNVIICGDEVVNSKPNPEIFLKAAEKLEADPKNCIVLEDSPAGIEAAYSGGMMGINVPDLKEPDEQIKRLAYKICDSLLEVKDYLNMVYSEK